MVLTQHTKFGMAVGGIAKSTLLRMDAYLPHDGVYKLSDQGIPVNLYTTVTKKGLNGIILAYSLAISNSEKYLRPLFRAFLIYLRDKYPTRYSQPRFMVDNEEGQINALMSECIDFSICRFH